MSDDVMVSVQCITYNHEKYIRKALDGFVMQKTNFRFEVIVHDDASTDCTAEIVQEYADKYDFDIKPWSNPLNWGRNLETIIGKKKAGEGVPFEINIYGSKQLTPILPWIK